MKAKTRRDNRIKKLRLKGYKLEEIGKRVGLTGERVRQIIDGEKIQESQKMTLKKREEYLDKIEFLMKSNLMNEIIRLSKPDRSKFTVQERTILIRILKNEYGFSFKQIGFLLDRDHTTILHNYYKK